MNFFSLEMLQIEKNIVLLPQYKSIKNISFMKRTFIFSLIMATLLPFAMQCQVSNSTVIGHTTPLQLLDDFFKATSGSGITISNAQFKNNDSIITDNQIGTFTNTPTSGNNMDASSGIVLCTHGVDGAGSNNPWNGDDSYCPQLRSTLGLMCLNKGMYDVSRLDFDFVVDDYSKNSVEFQYVFSSNEYCGYVCTQFSDGFGFYLSGPFNEDGTRFDSAGVVPYYDQNLAAIPDTLDLDGIIDSMGSIYVGTNTVNPGNKPFVQSCCYNNYTGYFDGCSGELNPDWQYGATKLMVSWPPDIIPGKKYKMVVGLCNTGDHALQSYIFLQKNTFKATYREKLVGLNYISNFGEGIEMFPNPANDNLQITSLVKIKTIEIYNIIGQRVKEQSIDNMNASINVSELNAGNYIVKLFTAQGLVTKKLVKQ
jgi:hypothetical protein